MNESSVGRFSELICFSEGLRKIGFTKRTLSDTGRVKSVTFESQLYQFYIVFDSVSDEVSYYWKKKGCHKIIPDPMKAIFFFSENVELICRDINSSGDDFGILIQIYLMNRWVFDSTSWLHDEKFILAIKRTDEWAIKAFRLLLPFEYERKLIGFR